MVAAELFVALLAVYAVAGVVFAAAFVTLGIHRVDHAATRAGAGFRLIVAPGVAALWPLLLTRWIRSARI
ncbi:MAG TPA: hypothetical protein VKU19_00040 [Bryobacteraceae bacterium]|nr:hypothetical protein [Bryobacteraceae bacterium]